MPRERHAFFLADLWAHRAAYATGLVGSVFIWGWCVYRRLKLHQLVPRERRASARRALVQ